MKPLNTRNDLIALAQKLAPTRACARAIREAKITNLGGFSGLNGLQGWIVETESYNGGYWILAVVCDEEKRCHKAFYLKDIPWENWLGKITGKRGLLNGDDPFAYGYYRMQRKKVLREQQPPTAA
jgi:hypothetical protein